ncbi:hypothetical protein CPJCM30710_25350 [Clostridium polyendosporum]|uniref:Phage replisome organizer, putative, N-terminal region n=1 Tax=Clostridium polyendosporum TaxID=69208 RepID=A0A919S1S8_9CLOT|nr:phage replisome organizer N-terminal domain-containing protein [Clostridium polyendosporum]GIM29869.1 hypothetical protein CPJCM30710_25350 [Clostridium polyendosporum]
MAEIKWIKITTNMFDDEKIKLIDAMPEKDTIHYIWIRLLVQAGKTNANGYIFLNENVPYTEEMLATIFNRPLQSVRLALTTLKSFGMIQISDNHLIKISNWEKHQNIEGMEKVREQNRLRKQKQREKEKALLQPTKDEIGVTDNTSSVMSRDNHAIEGEVEGDIDIEVDSNTTTPTNDNQEVSSDYKLFFDNNMGHLITPFELQTLISYEEDGMEPAVITLALQQSVEANVRDIRYVKKILDRWLANKITTVKAVLLDRKNFESKKNSDSKSTAGKDNKKQYQSGKGLRFTDYEQREYDYNALEKKLLGWDDQ